MYVESDNDFRSRSTSIMKKIPYVDHSPSFPNHLPEFWTTKGLARYDVLTIILHLYINVWALVDLRCG